MITVVKLHISCIATYNKLGSINKQIRMYGMY